MGETKGRKKQSKSRRKTYECDNTQFSCRLDPGEVEGPIACGVCGAEMDCRRDCRGSSGWAGAMCGITSRYDYFTCPHSDEVWHKQATELRKQARNTCSGKLAQMFLDEAAEIISTKTATKEDGFW